MWFYYYNSVRSVVNRACVECLGPLSSRSFFKQKASAAAEMTPATPAAPADSERLWYPPPQRPATVRLAQLLRRFSRLTRHLLASWWYCTRDSSLATLILDARDPLSTGLRFGSSSQRFRKREASPWPVCSARCGDRLRDLRIRTRAGTDDRNIATVTTTGSVNREDGALRARVPVISPTAGL